MEYWIVGPNYTDGEKEFRVFYNDCRRLKMPFDRPGTYYDARGGAMAVSLWEGRFLVSVRSAAHPESLVGEGLHGAVMAEAAKMKESVWVKYVRPTLSDFNGWSLFNSTPEGRNWFHRLWTNGQDPEFPEWESWRQPSWTNPYVFPRGREDREVKSMRDDLTQEAFAQEVECDFSEFVGRVYKDWDEEVHVRKLEYNPTWPTFIATDYGYTNPNVALFLQLGPFGEVHVLAEYYQRLRTDDEFAEDVLESDRLRPLVDAATALYPDPEDPGATRTLADKWKVSPKGGTGGLLKDRIKLIQKALEIKNTHLEWGDPERRPLLLVDRSCRETIREMGAYRYPELRRDVEVGQGKENPMKKDDHAPEALSRFFGGHFGTTKAGRPRTREAIVVG